MRRHRLLDRLSPYLETMAAAGPIAMDWLSGFCLLVRMSAWQQAGGFDPSFFLYYEDVDLCRRVHEHGSEVVCLTDVAATHLGSASTKRVGKRRLLLGGMCTYFSKHGSAGQRLPARLLGAAL
jgi:GT2 family glycosyltransferase